MSDSTRVAAIFQVGAPGKRSPAPVLRIPTVTAEKIPQTFPLIGEPSPTLSSRPTSPFFHYFSAFSPANVSVSSSALRLSSSVSAGRALIHSVPSQLRSSPLRAPLLRPPFCPPAPPAASSCPFTSRRTRLPRLSSPPRLLVSLARDGNRREAGTQHRQLKYIVILILLTPA